MKTVKEISWNEDKALIELVGEIDIYNAPQIRKVMLELLQKTEQDIVINLAQLRYIDSTGLGLLVGALKRVRERNGKIVLQYPQATVRKLLDITGLDQVFVVEEDK